MGSRTVFVANPPLAQRPRRLASTCLAVLASSLLARAPSARAQCTYVLGGPAARLTTDSVQWSWDGGVVVAPFRGALVDPVNFGPTGADDVTFDLRDLPEVDAPSLAALDGFIATWWSDREATPARVSAVVTFFRGGGDLILWQDDDAHDAIGAALGLPTTESMARTDSNGGPPLFLGPFGAATDVTMHYLIGQLDPAALGNRGGLVGGTNTAGEITSAYWPEGTWFDPATGSPCTTCGRLVIVPDVDVMATEAVPTRYVPPIDDNARFALNAMAFLAGCGNASPRCEAGDDIAVECGEGIPLAGAATDPDGDVLTVAWTSDCGAVFSDPAALDSLVSFPSHCMTCTLTLSVDDGNGGNCSDDVFASIDDVTPPVLSERPDDFTMECSDPLAPPPTVTATDGCDGSVGVNFDERVTPGPCPGAYTITRTWDAQDSCGNPVGHAQAISVVDTMPPDIRPRASDAYCLWPPNHRLACFTAGELDADFGPTVLDACPGRVSWRIVGCASNQPANDTGDGNTDEDCVVSPDGTQVCMRAERDGGDPNGRTYTVRVEAVDACGLTSQADVGTVHVPHDQNPHARDCRSATPDGPRGTPGRRVRRLRGNEP